MVSNYLTMLCKDILSIIYDFEHHNDIKQIKKQIYEQVGLYHGCFDFTLDDRESYPAYILTHTHEDYWIYDESIEITNGEFLMVENYYSCWFDDDDLYCVFSFINGEVYILDLQCEIKEHFKLVKHPYFNSRRDVYEKFRSYYRSMDEVSYS